MRVKVNDRYTAIAIVTSESRHVRERNRVVAAKHHRNNARRRHVGDTCFKTLERQLGIARRHFDVTQINDPEFTEGVNTKCEGWSTAIVGQVIRGSNRLGAKAAAGTM
jgi:hypothetical protein